MCLSLSRPELVESLIVEDISPRISSSIGLIPNFIEVMKIAMSAEDLPWSQVGFCVFALREILVCQWLKHFLIINNEYKY